MHVKKNQEKRVTNVNTPFSRELIGNSRTLKGTQDNSRELKESQGNLIKHS